MTQPVPLSKVANDGGPGSQVLATPIHAMAQLRRVFLYVRPYSARLAGAMLCLVIASGLGLAYPYFLGVVAGVAFRASELTVLDAKNELGRTSLILLAIFLAQAIFVSVHQYIIAWIGERVVADVRKSLYRHIIKLSPSYFHGTSTGVLLSRLTDDVSQLQRTVSQDLSVLLRNVLVRA